MRCGAVTMRDPIAEVGPEFGSQVDESIVRNVDTEMHQRGFATAAGRGVITVRNRAAGGAASDAVEVESITSAIFANNDSTAHSIGEAMPERVSPPQTVIHRILVKTRGDNKITKEILRGDISPGRAKALAEGLSTDTILWIRLRGLREAGIK